MMPATDTLRDEANVVFSRGTSLTNHSSGLSIHDFHSYDISPVKLIKYDFL